MLKIATRRLAAFLQVLKRLRMKYLIIFSHLMDLVCILSWKSNCSDATMT